MSPYIDQRVETVFQTRKLGYGMIPNELLWMRGLRGYYQVMVVPHGHLRLLNIGAFNIGRVAEILEQK